MLVVETAGVMRASRGACEFVFDLFGIWLGEVLTLGAHRVLDFGATAGTTADATVFRASVFSAGRVSRTSFRRSITVGLRPLLEMPKMTFCASVWFCKAS